MLAGRSIERVESSPVDGGKKHLPTITLRSLRLHAITERACIDHIMRSLADGCGGWVVTPNLDILRRAECETSFRLLVEQADMVVADGMPLIWASRLQGTPLPERIAGSTLITTLSATAAEQGRSVYLLGGSPGTAERAAEVLSCRSPSLIVAGTHCPPVGFENETRELDDIERRLLSAQPDIVYVALGSPKQEQLIGRLRDRLPAAWWLGIGISFSFLAGEVRRAPQWMQRSGLEWLHRFAQQPRRLARRYLIDGLPYAARVLTSAALYNKRAHEDAA